MPDHVCGNLLYLLPVIPINFLRALTLPITCHPYQLPVHCYSGSRGQPVMYITIDINRRTLHSYFVARRLGMDVRLVRAKFAFKATNNDELSFQKGDTVTITQAIDGGWWEGTLNGKTGWFPSNYVIELKTGM